MKRGSRSGVVVCSFDDTTWLTGGLAGGSSLCSPRCVLSCPVQAGRAKLKERYGMGIVWYVMGMHLRPKKTGRLCMIITGACISAGSLSFSFLIFYIKISIVLSVRYHGNAIELGFLLLSSSLLVLILILSSCVYREEVSASNRTNLSIVNQSSILHIFPRHDSYTV